MKPTDTPRTNAFLTELSIFKEATFEYIVSQTQRHADFTRSLERENNLLRDCEFNQRRNNMGFNLQFMFDELFEILASGKVDSMKVEELTKAISDAKRYAEECGMLNS